VVTEDWDPERQHRRGNTIKCSGVAIADCDPERVRCLSLSPTLSRMKRPSLAGTHRGQLSVVDVLLKRFSAGGLLSGICWDGSEARGGEK